jgi:Rrf2 family transcriptional regulator, cysteine metabolism repressor
MRLSTRGRYGTRAILDIALFAGDGPVNLRKMSERQNISTDYLEQLLRKLRNAGLVRSIRGPKGGFMLAKEAEDITIWEIVNAVEQEVLPVHCVDAVVGNRAPKKKCARVKGCATHRLWAGLAREMRNYLEGINLKDLVEDSKALGDQFLTEEQPMFYI